MVRRTVTFSDDGCEVSIDGGAPIAVTGMPIHRLSDSVWAHEYPLTLTIPERVKMVRNPDGSITYTWEEE